MSGTEEEQGVCRAKVGLLFLRDCGEIATETCTVCGRAICRRHECDTSRGTTCPECGAQDRNAQSKGSVQSVRRRRGWYGAHGYYPYYYGHHSYYSDGDYRAFDDDEMVEHEPASAEDAEAFDEMGDGFEQDQFEADDLTES